MSFKNILLRKLSPADLELLMPSFTHVEMKLREVIEERGAVVEHAYFVEDGLISLVAEYERGREVEVGVIGREGFSNVGAVMGDFVAVQRANIQVAGSAVKIPASVLAQAAEASPSLRTTLLLFARSLQIQVASTASANGRAQLEQRLARWILMVQDRLDSDVFSITHEFLAQMLCSRRPGVTVALHLLEGKGYIHSTRGQIAIVNRDGLEDEARGSYGFAESEYTRLIGEDFRESRAPGAGVKAKMQAALMRTGRV